MGLEQHAFVELPACTTLRGTSPIGWAADGGSSQYRCAPVNVVAPRSMSATEGVNEND
jgi:hypothetical protein